MQPPPRRRKPAPKLEGGGRGGPAAGTSCITERKYTNGGTGRQAEFSRNPRRRPETRIVSFARRGRPRGAPAGIANWGAGENEIETGRPAEAELDVGNAVRSAKPPREHAYARVGMAHGVPPDSRPFPDNPRLHQHSGGRNEVDDERRWAGWEHAEGGRSGREAKKVEGEAIREDRFPLDFPPKGFLRIFCEATSLRGWWRASRGLRFRSAAPAPGSGRAIGRSP